MQRKKAILIVSGILLVAIVALLIVLTADQPGSGNLLGYTGPSVSGEGSLAYMRIEGLKQGVVDGGVTDAGREATHAIYSIEHLIEVPIDQNTGMPTGMRRHRPFVVTTQISSGTPLLNQMCTTGEQAKVTIEYWHINAQGQEEKYYEAILDSALVMKISQYKPMVFIPENESYGDMVEISFSYKKITWRHLASGIETYDDWRY
ncbi:MAG: type VI secretion system tube protein Hcp [Clostridiaceae bacterium]|nr:type VI secretion system tube protein Hcp [Clostridiaceae bacterium]